MIAVAEEALWGSHDDSGALRAHGDQPGVRLTRAPAGHPVTPASVSKPTAGAPQGSPDVAGKHIINQ